MLELARPPSVFICASAIGYYGDRREEILTEQSGPGTGFLTEVVVGWEKATQLLSGKGVRVVHLRFGMILSAEGGALRKMLPPFRMGLGGPLGSGEQWMSWIAIKDVARLILFGVERTDISGIFNAVAPEPVRNREFVNTLGEVLRRPTFFRIPKFALRLAFGREMADELLLSSVRVLPARLQVSDFAFQYPDLKNALVCELLSKKRQ